MSKKYKNSVPVVDDFVFESVEKLQAYDKTQYKSTRNWVAVLYPENMVVGWEDRIYRLLQVPFAYIIHDKDDVELDDDIYQAKKLPRKTHIHIMIHYGNTTTYQSALDLFNSLSALGKRCCNTCQPVRNITYMYSYFTHNTPDSRDKFQYSSDSIVLGNNFDLGQYIEIQEEDLSACLEMITDVIMKKHLQSYTQVIQYNKKSDFVSAIIENFDIQIGGFRFLMKYRSFITEVCKGVYLDRKQASEK